MISYSLPVRDIEVRKSLQDIIDCDSFTEEMLLWLNEYNTDAPKPIHFYAGSKTHARIFFAKGSPIITLFLIKFGDQLSDQQFRISEIK
jgi:hypothetical protein